MADPRLNRRQPRPPGLLDAGPLSADIASFRLHLAAEGKSARTVQSYTSAVRWFAADYLLGQAGKTSWDQVDARDIQQWMVQLLDRYSSAYASIQFRALRQFFKWRAAEEQCPDPMTRLRAPKVTVTAVPVFTSGELSELQRACQGRSFAARRDAAIIAVLTATGIRLSELAGIRCHPGDPARSDLDLQPGRSGSAARAVQPGPSRSPQPPRRPQPRPLPAGPRPTPPGLAAAAVARRQRPGAAHRGRHLPGRRPPRPAIRGERVPAPLPAPLQPHLAGPRRRRTGPDGTQRLDLLPDAHPLRRQRPRRPRPPQLRPHHERHTLTSSHRHPPRPFRPPAKESGPRRAASQPSWTTLVTYPGVGVPERSVAGPARPGDPAVWRGGIGRQGRLCAGHCGCGHLPGSA